MPSHSLFTSLLIILLSLTLFTHPTNSAALLPRQTTTATASQTYTYLSVWATTTIMPPTPTAPCPTAIYTDTTQCPQGCTPGYVAGAVGMVTSEFLCYTMMPVTMWTSVMATDTCAAGSTVHTWTEYGGQTEVGCQTVSSTG